MISPLTKTRNLEKAASLEKIEDDVCIYLDKIQQNINSKKAVISENIILIVLLLGFKVKKGTI